MAQQHADHTANDVHEGHEGHEAHGTDHSGHAEMFHRLFWRNLILAVPVIATSGMLEGWLGYDLPGTAWIPPLLGTAVFVYGVRATVDGEPVAVGGPTLLDESGATAPDSVEDAAASWRDKGGAVLYVVADGEVVGAFTTTDPVRKE